MARYAQLISLWLSLLITALALPPYAHASESTLSLRYRGTTHGAVLMTGNTLGLAKELGSNAPGTADSIGVFICEPPASEAEPAAVDWVAPTCTDWRFNASSAYLDLPEDAEVLYAEVLWGGSFRYGEQDVEAHLDDNVRLWHENHGPVELAVDTVWRHWDELSPVDGFPIRYYVRSSDVTALVGEWGEGRYTLGGVPATITPEIDTLNAAGWTLVVAYKSYEEPSRTLSVFTGGVWVDELRQGEERVRVVGDRLCVPPYGNPQGELAISAMEGDANLSGDTLTLRYAHHRAELNGPNNPRDNFFGSQLNQRTGALDERGTFGGENHDPWIAANQRGARQGWDTTNLLLDSDRGELPPGTRAIELEVETTGDSFALIATAFSVDAHSARVLGHVDYPHVYFGHAPLAFAAEIRNEGRAHALSPFLHIDLPEHFGDAVELCVNHRCNEVATASLRGGHPLTQPLQTGGSMSLRIQSLHNRVPEAPLPSTVTLYVSYHSSPCEGELSETQLDEVGSFLLYAPVMDTALEVEREILRPQQAGGVIARAVNSGNGMYVGGQMEWELAPELEFVPGSLVAFDSTRGERPVPQATQLPDEVVALSADAIGEVRFEVRPRGDAPAGLYPLTWRLHLDQEGTVHEHTAYIEVTRCGDGVVNGDEQCDDGGEADGDGCSATCKSEAPLCADGSPASGACPSSATSAALSGGRYFGCSQSAAPARDFMLALLVGLFVLFRLRDERSRAR